MKERIRTAVILFITFALISALFGTHTVYPSDNPNQEQISGDGWYITGNREKRGDYYQVDGTEDMFFVCYFNGAIDAYNNDGEYLFTYEIYSSSRNGGATIKCTDDLIYIQYKDSDVFTFQGTELVARLTYSEFRDLGYYMKPSGAVFIARDGMYRQDAAGEPHYLCALPDAISEALPVISFAAATEKLIVIVLAVAVFLVAGYCIFIQPRVRKNANGKVM